ncbi:hypothetical protein VTN77DRAFT_4319 [Rasamsonia byssochlamydoides]|uniref:uncharacterized protein n=1 Tax=Rasamsonia byssochlamydoides TaxID=89139 RepID=UPI0037433620
MAHLVQKQIAVIVSYVVLNVVSIVAVGLRFYAISLLRRQIKVHDILCTVSLVGLLAYSIDTMIGTIDGGIGLHITQLTMPQLTIALKTFFASEFFWSISIASFRLSILCLYIQIFPTPIIGYFAYASMTIVGLFFIGSIITILTICRPIAFTWDKTLHGVCGDEATAELVAASFNMVLDVVIVLLPFPVVWKLQMAKQKKAAVLATFALGLSISGINLARIIKVLDCSLLDFTYCTADSAILTVAEMAVGIVVACVPTLGPVFYPHRHGSRNRYYKASDLEASTDHVRLRNYQNQFFARSDRDTNVEPVAAGNITPPLPVKAGEIGVRRDFEVSSQH